MRNEQKKLDNMQRDLQKRQLEINQARKLHGQSDWVAIHATRCVYIIYQLSVPSE